MDAKALTTTQDYLDKRYLAELVGTLALVLVGCASITISGFGGAFPLAIPFNPARSLGPAVFVGGTALKQLWLFLLVPTVAGAISGWLVRAKILDA
jgi:aquaporin Z